MKCRDVERLLSHYLEGRLSGRKAMGIAAHLRQCCTCDRLRQEIAAAEAALRDLPDPLPPSDIERRAVHLWLRQREALLSGPRRAVPQPVAPPFPTRRPMLQTVVLLAALLLAILGLELPAAGGITASSSPCQSRFSASAGAAALASPERV